MQIGRMLGNNPAALAAALNRRSGLTTKYPSGEALARLVPAI
jgi:hypothetical protein